jgi:uncharacterized protein with von Willebrand factor type A (vWA) domain
MEHRIARFIAGLRAMGVRVSIAESQDAWRAIEDLGIADRDQFKLSLRATLVKDYADYDTFDDLFPLYFGNEPPPLLNPQAELSQEEQQMLMQAVKDLAGDLQELLNWLLSGQGPSKEEMDDLAQQAGMDNANSPYQSRWYARRMQRLLGWDRLDELLDMLWEYLAEMGMDPQSIQQLKQQVGQNKETVGEQLEQFAGEKIQDNMIEEQRRRPETINDLMQRPFGSLNESDLDALRDQVRRLAARIRTRAALRQKRAKEGKLDAKATIRANQRYGGVPLDIKMKKKRLKPKLLVLIDVSRSMEYVVEFFLRLTYELQDQIQKSYSFAYYDHLEDVTTDLAVNRVEEAIRIIGDKLPYIPYGTNLGVCLRQFSADHMSKVDSRTTVIVVGDGRNNYNDPALGVFADVRKRARKMIWMNPEYPAQWGTGDSDMHAYQPMCTSVYQVRNLQQLTEAIDHMLG